jgi:hypothetical protein
VIGRYNSGCGGWVGPTVQAGSRRKRSLRMGWKPINGHRYYYKSKRVGSRIESTYLGAENAALSWPASTLSSDWSERPTENGSGRNSRNPARRNEPSRDGPMACRRWPMRRWSGPGSTNARANGGGNDSERNRDAESGSRSGLQAETSGPGKRYRRIVGAGPQGRSGLSPVRWTPHPTPGDN